MGGGEGMFEFAENIATQPSLAGAWALLGKNNILFVEVVKWVQFES